jgi:hypothetical protein
MAGKGGMAFRVCCENSRKGLGQDVSTLVYLEPTHIKKVLLPLQERVVGSIILFGRFQKEGAADHLYVFESGIAL